VTSYSHVRDEFVGVRQIMNSAPSSIVISRVECHLEQLSEKNKIDQLIRKSVQMTKRKIILN